MTDNQQPQLFSKSELPTEPPGSQPLLTPLVSIQAALDRLENHIRG